ncbi:unnamed protein product [Closterium sp. NIES-53]
MQEEDHSRRFADQESEDPTDEIDSLLGAILPMKQGLQELSSLGWNATNHAGLLPEYLGRRVTGEEQTAHGVGSNGENFFLGFHCDGEEGSVHGPSGATLGALLGSVLSHAGVLGAAVSDDPGFQAHQVVLVPPVTTTALHTRVNGKTRPASVMDALLRAPRATAQAAAQACDQAWSNGFSTACGTSYHTCSTDFNTSSLGYMSRRTSYTGSGMNRSHWHSPPLHAEATEGVEEVGLVQHQQQQDPPGTGTCGSQNSCVLSKRNSQLAAFLACSIPSLQRSQLEAFPTAPMHEMFGAQNSLVPSMHKVLLLQLAAFPTAAEHAVFGQLTMASAQQKLMCGRLIPVAAVFAFLGGSSSTQVSDFAAADVWKEMQLWVEGAA